MDTLPDLALKKIFSFLDAEDKSCFIHLSRRLRHRFALHVCLKELDSLRLDDGMFDVDLKRHGWDKIKERFWEGKANDNLVDYVVSLYIQYCVDYSRNWRKGYSKRTKGPKSKSCSTVDEVRVFGNLVIILQSEHIRTYRLDDFEFMAYLKKNACCFKDEWPDDSQMPSPTRLRQYNSTVIAISIYNCCIPVFDLNSITKDFEGAHLQPQRVLKLGEHHNHYYPSSYDVNQHMIVVVNGGNVYMWPRVPADQVRSPSPSHILKDPFNMKGRGGIEQVAINNRFAIVEVQRSTNALFKWHLDKTTVQLDRSVKRLKCSRYKVQEFIISKDDFVAIKGYVKYQLINVVKDELLYTIEKHSDFVHQNPQWVGPRFVFSRQRELSPGDSEAMSQFPFFFVDLIDGKAMVRKVHNLMLTNPSQCYLVGYSRIMVFKYAGWNPNQSFTSYRYGQLA